MKKNKKYFVFSSIYFCMLIILFTGCMPAYYFTKQPDETSGEFEFAIEGNYFRSKHTFWDILGPYKKIGYIEKPSLGVYESEKYSQRLFLYVEEWSGEAYPQFFCRADIDIPPVDFRNVDGFEWISDQVDIEAKDFYYGANTRNDSKLIKQICDILYSPNIVTDWMDKDGEASTWYAVGNIYLYNSDLPGIAHIVRVTKKNGMYWVSSDITNALSTYYQPISQELLIQIIGENKMPER